MGEKCVLSTKKYLVQFVLRLNVISVLGKGDFIKNKRFFQFLQEAFEFPQLCKNYINSNFNKYGTIERQSLQESIHIWRQIFR